ncbi:MAG TPA: cytochrome C oxidase subunit IV family protein [Lacipirellulaceae bacterium]|jgi:cytochrome c oxidase subunit 4
MHTNILSKATYYKVAVLLGILLAATVVVAQFDLGVLNTAIALTIAFAKAALIVLFFMHLRYSWPLLRLFAASGLIWLAIMITFVLADVLTRK